MMDIKYLLSQVCVILAMLGLGATYLVKDKKTIMFLCVLYTLFYGLEYLLLDAYSGLSMCVVNVIRNIWFYINANLKKKNSIIVLIVLSIITIVFGIFSFNNIFSVLPIIATLIYTYSVWQDDTKLYRYLAFPCSLCWMTYNISCRSLFGVIAECILIIFEIIGVIKLYKKEK